MNKEILEFINESILFRKEFLNEHTGILGEIKYPSVIRCKKELSIFEQIKKELEENDIKNYAKIKCEAAPVLDDVEKRYLKNVIRPFKDQCRYVKKYGTAGTDYEWIYINLSSNDSIALPGFSKGTMYKNMEPNVKYTLKDLGITYE